MVWRQIRAGQRRDCGLEDNTGRAPRADPSLRRAQDRRRESHARGQGWTTMPRVVSSAASECACLSRRACRGSVEFFMSNTTFTALGIDVGGTKIAAGIVSFPEGRVGVRQVIPTAPARGGAAVLDDVVRLAEELITEAGSSHPHITGLGIGLCELVDPKGHILSAHCVQWQDQPVRERLARIAPVTLEADVRAAALAEAHFGAGKPFRIFLYVTVGTGIASCLMLNGRPYVGARGVTGTMASSPLSVPCEQCGHTSRRTLEELAAGPALVARLSQRKP